MHKQNNSKSCPELSKLSILPQELIIKIMKLMPISSSEYCFLKAYYLKQFGYPAIDIEQARKELYLFYYKLMLKIKNPELIKKKLKAKALALNSKYYNFEILNKIYSEILHRQKALTNQYQQLSVEIKSNILQNNWPEFNKILNNYELKQLKSIKSQDLIQKQIALIELKLIVKELKRNTWYIIFKNTLSKKRLYFYLFFAFTAIIFFNHDKLSILESIAIGVFPILFGVLSLIFDIYADEYKMPIDQTIPVFNSFLNKIENKINKLKVSYFL